MMADEGKAQREQILRQQMRTIKEELGEGGEEDEVDELRERLRKAGLPDEVQKVARKQLGRMSGHAAAVGRVQRDAHATSSGWPTSRGASRRPTSLDVEETRRCLDEDHYGLEKIKKRIIEYVAVRKLARRQEGPDPLLHRPAGRRQDVARAVHRALDGAALPPHRARRRARRGGDPRPPAHVRRRAPRPHRPGDEEGRREEPGPRARRGRQDGRRHARRSRGRAARGARPRAERDVPGPLPRRALRSLAGHVPLHGEQPGHHPGGALGPHGGHRVPGLHARREALIARDFLCPQPALARTGSPTSGSSSSSTAWRASSTSYTREAGVRGLERGDRRRCAATS